VRYVFYFEQLIKERMLGPRIVYLEQIEFISLPTIKHNFRLQVAMYDARTYEMLEQNHAFGLEEVQAKFNQTIKFKSSTPVCGDLFFSVIHRSTHDNNKDIARFGIHTSYLT
jgi:hypothetical protein